MTVEEIRGVLADAMALRMPRFGEQPPAERVSLLEDYLGETAIARGELEEARFHAYEAGRELAAKWEALSGHENFLEGPRHKATQAQVDAAKRRVQPDIWDGLQEAKYLVERLGDQIKRLVLDDAAASRRYTMVTGS